MFYTIYKTTNQINGKFYIGAHKTEDLNDNYLGSGKLLKKAKEKYGVDNFSKEVLFVFETAEEMFAKEADLVSDEFLSENNTYNLKVGGFGGFDYINSTTDTELRKSAGSDGGKKSKPPKTPEYKKKLSDAMLKRHKLGLHPKISKSQAFSGKHRDSSKAKMSEKAKGQHNSQYGTMWINDGKISMKIKKSEPIPDGWVAGRKLTMRS